MSIHIVADSLEEIHHRILSHLARHASFESSPRGRPIREELVSSFQLTDPRNRLILSPARAVNYGFAVGELCWYIRGDSDLRTMLYYNKRMSQFSDDGETINSAYGARMFNGSIGFPGQLANVIDELKRDPDSRRAVMHINRPMDLQRAVNKGSKDVPCTMSVQLLIRDRRLHMHVLMRSNDVVWGMPYDAFSFTCLQETFLLALQAEGVPVDGLGSYHHTAGSLHLYSDHFSLAEEVAKEAQARPAPMKPFTLNEMMYLSETIEPTVRKLDGFTTWTEPDPSSATYWMMERLLDHRAKRTAEEEKKESK